MLFDVFPSTDGDSHDPAAGLSCLGGEAVRDRVHRAGRGRRPGRASSPTAGPPRRAPEPAATADRPVQPPGRRAARRGAAWSRVLSHLERVTGEAAEAVTEASSDAIRLRRALDTLPQGVIVCDENGDVAFRNARAVALMNNRHGDALAAQAVTELLENAWQDGTAERTLDLYGPPRQTLTVRTRLHRRRAAASRGDRHHRGRVRAAAARGDPPGFRGQRQPRAQDPHRRPRPAGRDPDRRARPDRRPTPGLPHPHRGLPGQPHHRRPARPQPDRVRGGPAPGADLRQPVHGRGRGTGQVRGRAATHYHRAR